MDGRGVLCPRKKRVVRCPVRINFDRTSLFAFSLSRTLSLSRTDDPCREDATRLGDKLLARLQRCEADLEAAQHRGGTWHGELELQGGADADSTEALARL